MKLTALLCAVTLLLLSSFISVQANETNGSVHLLTNTPYAKGHDIRNNIIDECTKLGSSLASFTRSYADKKNINIVLDDQIDFNASGKYLHLEISDAVSRGNAFIGHSKFVTVKGTLWENGKSIASFDGQRSSMGGFMAGYKGSCSVLGRCVKTLGKDIATWLESPVDGASIGE